MRIYKHILITSHLCNKQGTETEHVNNGEGKITCLTWSKDQNLPHTP